MRIIRFLADDNRTVLHGADLGDGSARLLEGSILDRPRATQQRIRIGTLLAPIVPTDLICVGRNYGDAARAARRGDHTLEVFLKPVTALQNPGEPIRAPNFDGIDAQLDCEGELAVVISRETRKVPETRALDHVLGYTIANDVTARAFQTSAGPPIWMRGKGFDTFCPLGPAIVTRDKVTDPQHLSLRTIVGDVITREGSTADMSWSVAEIIACLSRHMTLMPGTVVLTGAPVASAAASSVVVRAQTSIRIELERIGTLANVIAG